MASDLAKPGTLDLLARSLFCKTVIVALAVAVDDAEARSRTHGNIKCGKHRLRVGDLVVDLQHHHSVHAVGREPGICGSPQYGLDVGKVLCGSAFVDGFDVRRIDVLCKNCARGANAFRGKYGKPAATGADVGYRFAGGDAHDVHDSVDMQPLGAAWSFEDVQVAGVRCAGGVL